MSPNVRPRRRLLPWFAGAVALCCLALLLLRKPLLAAAVAISLRGAGAGEVSLDVSAASPWAMEIHNLGFQVRTQRFDAELVRIDRAQWWRPSLGVVRVEGARLPITLDGPTAGFRALTTRETAEAAPRLEALKLPADSLSIDGVLVLHAAGQLAEEVKVEFAARPDGRDRWTGGATVSGPGLAASLEGAFDLGSRAVEFRLKDAVLDLALWQGHLRSLVVLPGGRWEFGGRVEGEAAGSYAGGALAATASLRLSEGRVASDAQDVAVEGLGVELAFTDLAGLVTAPGRLHARELRVGAVRAADVEIKAALAGPGRIEVAGASLRAFDGRLEAEPFALFLGGDGFEATVQAERLSVEALLAVAPSVPAQATGRVDGRLPFRLDGDGLRLGTGWLELTPGERAEVRIQAAGLLTRGVEPSRPAFVTLQRIETGLLQLELTRMRLDIRAPGSPAGRSATLRVAGEPVDKSVRAPVSLDLNVNGPIEDLLNMGLDKRVRFGGSK